MNLIRLGFVRLKVFPFINFYIRGISHYQAYLKVHMTVRNNLSHHILSTSAQLVGVCLTVISLVKAFHMGQVGTILDKLLALDALLFTASAVLSYMSMRKNEWLNLEKYADQFFMLGLLELGLCAILLAFEMV